MYLLLLFSLTHFQAVSVSAQFQCQEPNLMKSKSEGVNVRYSFPKNKNQAETGHQENEKGNDFSFLVSSKGSCDRHRNLTRDSSCVSNYFWNIPFPLTHFSQHPRRVQWESKQLFLSLLDSQVHLPRVVLMEIAYLFQMLYRIILRKEVKRLTIKWLNRTPPSLFS